MTLGDLLRLEAEQLADAVVLVDDVVAGAQVGERLERAAEARVGARRRACGRPACPAAATSPSSRQTKPRRAGATANSELRLARERPRLVLEQLAPRPGAACSACAAPRRGAGTRRRRAGRARTNARELVLGLGRARAPRSPGAAPRTRTAGPTGTGRAPTRRVERDRVEPTSSRPDPAHLVRLPDEVRRPVERRHEVVGDAAAASSSSSRERRLDEVEAPLGRRVDQRRVDRVQRALRERREGADRLDLVAEELDPERLAAGRREDVDDAAADGELAALLDLLDALVAGERELPRRAPSMPGSSPTRDLERLRAARRRGGSALGERGRRGADEPAAREHVERAGPLADEVRRRLEPGAPADAAARQQPDALGAEEPARRLGRVARVGVLGQDADERAAELLVERGEQRAAAPARTRARARAARRRSAWRRSCAGKLAHERVQDGPFGEGLWVHAVRRNRGSAGVIVAVAPGPRASRVRHAAVWFAAGWRSSSIARRYGWRSSSPRSRSGSTSASASRWSTSCGSA